MRDRSGECVWMNGNMRRLEGGGFVARVSLPVGVYRLTAGARKGHAVEAALIMTRGAEAEPLRLTFESDPGEERW